MNQEAWPAPHESPREPLPRVEDLPIAEQGYEQDSVRAAFDSFYRHAAQLDAALRTLEAVDSFHRQAAALRADIRTLRTAGWTQQPWGATPTYGYVGRAPREGVSPAVWRIAGEAAFLIAAAVVLGVAKVDWWLIVVVMAGAWLLVGLLEWAAARDRYAAPRPVAEPPHPVVEAPPPAEGAEEEAHGWAAFEAAQEPSDAMTMIGGPSTADEPEVLEEPVPSEEAALADVDGVAPPSDAPQTEPPSEAPVQEPPSEPEPAVEAAAAQAAPAREEEPEPAVEAAAPEAEAEQEPEYEPEAAVAGAPAEAVAAPEPEPVAADEPAPAAEQPKRRWWRRRHAEQELPADAAAEPPRHVRVLPAEEHDEPAKLDPWEAGFDEPVPGPVGVEPDEDTGEDTATFAADGDDAGRRRFRRR